MPARTAERSRALTTRSPFTSPGITFTFREYGVSVLPERSATDIVPRVILTSSTATGLARLHVAVQLSASYTQSLTSYADERPISDKLDCVAKTGLSNRTETRFTLDQGRPCRVAATGKRSVRSTW